MLGLLGYALAQSHWKGTVQTRVRSLEKRIGSLEENLGKRMSGVEFEIRDLVGELRGRAVINGRKRDK